MYNTILHEVFETLIIVLCIFQTRSFYPHHRISYTNTLIFLYNEFVFVSYSLKSKHYLSLLILLVNLIQFPNHLLLIYFSQALEDKSTIYTHASLYSCQPILN